MGPCVARFIHIEHADIIIKHAIQLAITAGVLTDAEDATHMLVVERRLPSLSRHLVQPIVKGTLALLETK